MWDDSKYIAFDFETSGELPEYALQPWRVAQGKAWVTSLATVRKIPNDLTVAGGLLVDVPPPYLYGMIQGFLQQAIENGWTVVGWNVAFDIAWLIAYGFEQEVQQLKFLDGMLLWKHLTVEPEYDTVRHKKKSYSLKQAVREELPQFAGYEEDVDFHSTDPVELAKLQEYNVRDTMFTLRLTRTYYNLLAKDPQRLKAALIEADCLVDVAKANLIGMCVDVPTTQSLGNKLVEVADDMLLRLGPHGVTEKVVRSPKQLSTLLFETWGLPVLKQNTSKLTGNTTDSTDKEVLHELSFIDSRAAEIRLYREALGNKTKFVDAPLKSVDYNEDGKTHPLAMVFGTYTGRMTYASKQGKNKDERQIGFALHQMKRGKDFRSIIVPPPGYTLMEFDAAGQEVRWMAIASGDDNMLQMCMPGEDLHTFMGAAVGHVPYSELRTRLTSHDSDAKSLRQLGKVANLSCIAASNRVLTRRGYVPITQVTQQDVLWDGIEWVNHRGVICRGEKHVMQYQGLTLTPDHRVLTSAGWESAEHCRTHTSTLAASHCWNAIWGMDSYCARIASIPIQGKLSMLLWARAAGLRIRSVIGQKSILSPLLHHKNIGVQRVCSYVSRRYAAQAKAQVQRSASTVYKSFAPRLQVLRSAGHHFLLRITNGDDAVRFDSGVSGRYRYADYRQNRQHAGVLSGEFTASDTSAAMPESQTIPEKEKVYDILDCGPRNRFVVEGVIVHNCQYRTSAKKLRVVARVQYNLPMDMPEAEKIHTTYQQTYPGVPQYWRNQIALTKRLGYVETFAGRRVQVVGNWSGTQGWSMESTAINYRIQGTGGDQKYLALSVLKPYITRIGAIFAWELHDGIYLYVPDAMVERAATEIPYLLANLPYKKAWGFTPPIPLPWDVKWGQSWGTLTEWRGK